MEEELDQIGDGEQKWVDSLREYYVLLEKDLKAGQETEGVKKTGIPIDEKCPNCGAMLVQKFGKYGPFVACSDYPKCKYIKKENMETGIDCPLACSGKILRRKTRRGKLFYGCSNYPKCTFATWDEPVNRPCPACGQKFLLKKNLMRGDPYLHCWNEKCAFKESVASEKIWEKPKIDEDDPGTDEQGTL
jgi:DNA topoisomerase-1